LATEDASPASANSFGLQEDDGLAAEVSGGGRALAAARRSPGDLGRNVEHRNVYLRYGQWSKKRLARSSELWSGGAQSLVGTGPTHRQRRKRQRRLHRNQQS